MDTRFIGCQTSNKAHVYNFYLFSCSYATLQHELAPCASEEKNRVSAMEEELANVE